ncbi:MAG: ribonuclease HII [Anaerolineales bacterium]|nr:ribonuclease HII [Anaerolineales bacterium]
MQIPHLDYEQELLKQGYRLIAGVDEAGRGSIFGPVCVGMVVLPLDNPESLKESLAQVRDSKALYRKKVYRLAADVQAVALAWAVGVSSAKEVDQYGIMGAIRRAEEQALGMVQAQLGCSVDFLLTDSTMPTPTGLDESHKRSLIRGDAQCLSIACAAILAKSEHDRLVRQLAESCHPDYQLDSNVGYGTPAHIEAVRRLGGTPYHRYTFRPVGQPPLPFEGD